MVGKSISVNESLSLVPVSMGYNKEYAPDIVVYVEKTKGRMCISKVECSPGPNFRAPVYWFAAIIGWARPAMRFQDWIRAFVLGMAPQYIHSARATLRGGQLDAQQ